MLTPRPRISQTARMDGKHQAPIDESPNPTPSTRTNTHKNKRGIQISVVLRLEVPVVFFHFPLKLVVELRSGVGRTFSPQGSAAGGGVHGDRVGRNAQPGWIGPLYDCRPGIEIRYWNGGSDQGKCFFSFGSVFVIKEKWWLARR